LLKKAKEFLRIYRLIFEAGKAERIQYESNVGYDSKINRRLLSSRYDFVFIEQRFKLNKWQF